MMGLGGNMTIKVLKPSLGPIVVSVVVSGILSLSITGCAALKKSPKLNKEQSGGKNEASRSHPRQILQTNEVDAAFAQDIKDEVTVGRGISSRLLGTYGYYHKRPDLERYINLVGLSVALPSGRPELVYHFAILDSDEVNAFAAPGGFVFVTRGLMNQIRSEDELAGVLGHEIAHINLMHMYKQLKVKREVGVGEVLTRIMSRGAADLGGALNEMVQKGMKMLVEEGLGKEKEFEADSVGIAYAAAAGYDPEALSRLVARLDEANRNLKVAKTHPVGSDRLKALRTSIVENGLSMPMQKNKAVLSRRFAAATGG